MVSEPAADRRRGCRAATLLSVGTLDRRVPKAQGAPRVGPGRWDDEGEKRIPLDVAVGDVVLYSKYGGTEVKYGGEEYLVLSARDVLAVIEK